MTLETQFPNLTGSSDLAPVDSRPFFLLAQLLLYMVNVLHYTGAMVPFNAESPDMKPTTVYIEEKNRHALSALARKRRSTMASEIRAAISRHLTAPSAPTSKETLDAVLHEAESAVARIVERLDKAHARHQLVKKRLARLGLSV